MTEQESTAEQEAFNAIESAAADYAEAYAECGDRPMAYKYALKHLRMTIRERITYFSRRNYAEITQAEPVAYAVFADNGNIRIWSKRREEVERVAAECGKPLVALYASPQPRRELSDTDVIALATAAGFGAGHLERAIKFARALIAEATK